MGNELPTADALATKIFWITIVGAALFCASVILFVL
jgi:hypothetical protein